MSEKMLNVKNRSASAVIYKIIEDGIRREFAPGETKKLPESELTKLTYQAGGRTLIADYLLITDDAVLEDLGIVPEDEYFMTEQDVVKVIKEGSLEEFLDVLDFAAVGTIDLLKTLSVSIPLDNYEKKKALKEKTGFDVDAAIKHVEEDKAVESASATTSAAPKSTRRTSGNKYKVVNKEEVKEETAANE